jgi:hypothetical protein
VCRFSQGNVVAYMVIKQPYSNIARQRLLFAVQKSFVEIDSSGANGVGKETKLQSAQCRKSLMTSPLWG